MERLPASNGALLLPQANENNKRSSPPKRVSLFHMDALVGVEDNIAGSAQADASTLEAKRSNAIPLRLSKVDGNLCTHLILAHVTIEPQSGSLKLSHPDQATHLKEALEFRRRYPHVKLLISARTLDNSTQVEQQSDLTQQQQQQQQSYYNQISQQQQQQQIGPFLRATTSPDYRQSFARQAVEFLQRYQLDGLQLDWQPTNFYAGLLAGRAEQERIGLVKLVSNLRASFVENFYARQASAQQQALQRHSQQVAQVEQHLLSVSILSNQESALTRALHELKPLANLCDWLVILAFDYYFPFRAYAPFTGPLAPLEPIAEPYVPIVGKLALSCTLQRLLADGVPAEKLLVGVPTFGRAYRLLLKASRPAPLALALGVRLSTWSAGAERLSYGEVLQLSKQADACKDFDERARVPYLLVDEGYTWVTYEDERSIKEKVRYVLSHQLAGCLLWSLNHDDHSTLAPNLTSAASATTNSLAALPLQRAMHEESMQFDAN